MQDAENIPERLVPNQAEERSVAAWYLQGAATTAGGLTVIGAVNQGKQVIGKLKDKIAPKDED
jgi:hypothetical protein